MLDSAIPVLSIATDKTAWVTNNNGRNELRGRLRMAETEAGAQAEGMIARSEISALSAGYRVEEWEITDKDGRVLDPEVDRVRADDDLTFTATRWELLRHSSPFRAIRWR
jgi:hypothetical protein